MPSDVETIQTWLQSSYNVQVPPDWLNACVEWIQQENMGQLLSVSQLQPMVFEQWLMSDLKELGTACLPVDLPAQHCTHISGPLALQVESMLDVGAPLYGQLQKVKGTFNANSEISADKPQQLAWEPKASRMMLLKMTDGQTEVQGMEYRPIPALNSDLQPGFKVVVHGQVKCRQGVLLLTGDNVQVLGGEVDLQIEANPPVTVLEQAMERSTANTGKHARKEFSGRFLKKQDYTSHCQDPQDKKVKTEMTPWLPGPPSSREQARARLTGKESGQGDTVKSEGQAQWCAGTSFGMKQEPVSQPHALRHEEEEWEEDLDYGGLLDEAMEEDVPAVWEVRATDTPTSQSSGGPGSRNPFACVSNPSSTNLPVSGHQPSSCLQNSGTASMPVLRMQQDQNVADTAAEQGSEGQRVNQSVSQQSNKCIVAEDSLWDDDDDFDLAQVETDICLSVTPVQKPLDQNRQNIQHSDASMSIHSGLQKSHSLPATDFIRSNVPLKNFGKSASKTEGNSSAKSSSVSQDISKTTFPVKSEKSAENTKPPPAKQRKLTAMFCRSSKTEFKPAVSVSPVHADSVVDLTEDDAMSPRLNSCGHSVAVKEVADVKQERSKDLMAGVTGRSQGEVKRTGNSECQDIDMAKESNVKGNYQTAYGSQNERIPQAVIPPLNSEGEPVASESQTLKDMLTALQTDTDSEHSFTVKGYITTLTDRLRSCQGDQWSLSCRVTDGTAALEVGIADKVLAQLIGFTAKESITLRQQARKDTSVKDFLIQGLQKCQQYLIEFSGLMDIQKGKEDNKPSLVNMVKLETKKR